MREAIDTGRFLIYSPWDVRRKPVAKTKEHKVMGEFKRGKLHSGSKTGPKVKSRRQAIAIAMSEAGKSRKGSK
jgi:hypothetical protein